MKKFFLLYPFIFVHFLKAQQPVVTFGPELNWNNWSLRWPELMGNSSNLFYTTLNAMDGGLVLDFPIWRVNNLVARKDSAVKIKMPELDNKEVWFNSLLCVNNQPLMFANHFNKAKNAYQLSAFKFNSDLSLNKIPAIIDYAKKLSGLHIEVQESGKILVTYSENDNKNEKLKFNALLINADASVAWKKSIELPHLNGECAVWNFKVLKNGKLYFLARIDKKKEEQVKDKADLIFKLFEYDPVSNSGKEVVLNPADNYLIDLKLFFNKEEKLVCAGTFAYEKPDYDMGWAYTGYGRFMRGFFHCLLNNDFTQSGMEVKTLEMPKDQLRGAHLVDVFEMKNGTLMYLVEQKFKKGRSYEAKWTYSFMLINYDPIMKQQWIKRREWTLDHEYYKYNVAFHMNTDQKVCMVYCDSFSKKGRNFWYTLDQDGIEQEGLLLPVEDEDKDLVMRVNLRVSNNEYVSWMDTKRGMKFVKINFK